MHRDKRLKKEHESLLSNSSTESIVVKEQLDKLVTTESSKKTQQLLPISFAREQLVKELMAHTSLVLVGETGSGKTTQLPQIVLDSVLQGNGRVVCTQPRRVAAITVAKRVARERGVRLGEEVGYTVRFDDQTSGSTRLKYVTDGMLLREALLDPLLRRYKVIILDEAHERTVQTDVLFALVKVAQEIRKDRLRIVIMSATLNAEKFVKYFKGARAAYLQGRQFPVELFYTLEAQRSYIDAALSTVLQLHQSEAAGDILVFLTGQEEIENLKQLILERAENLKSSKAGSLEVVTIFAAQTSEQQMKVFQPAPKNTRKVILATNIAETSVTVPGVKFVVDSGLAKTRSFQAWQASESLQVLPISQAQARQRSGRAGREAPGKAFRLYTEDSFWQLPVTSLPEIQRVRLDTVVLQLKALGVENPLAFDFMDRPPEGSLLRALEQLCSLGALDENGALSRPLGVRLAKLPLDPALGKVLLAAADWSCAGLALAVLAMVSSDAVFQASRFVSPLGDHITMATVFAAFLQVKDEKLKWCQQNMVSFRALRKAGDIYRQLEQHLKDLGFEGHQSISPADFQPGSSLDNLRRALTSGLFMNAAVRQPDGLFKVIASGLLVHIHPSSVLHGKRPKCIVFGDLIHTTRNYAHQVTAIEPSWLPELAPLVFSQQSPAK